ncbi:hypothetical protein ILUMI_04663 [Ignelater luminosus]|uniref:Enkurin domain-containing protein n=1 Tax=Ignelater luminosus TaxID=2038154 RepID=A0A8K0DEC6_IGNLU|nr:hypothetical protein ILUMI_04663 [Ignelater luminosus]
MSIILITEHDENIYNSTKKSTTYHKKSPRYMSKFREPIKHEIATKIRKSHATMGLPRHPLPDPADFLKKNEGIRHRVSPIGSAKQISNLPPVPKTADLLEEDKNRARRPKKNFISENVKYVLNLRTKEPDKKVVIDRFGVSKKLCAGMEPRYIYSSTFGKTPTYLARFIKIKERNLQFKKDTSGTEQPKCRYITRDERDTLLAGLKENWEELQKMYQGLPILTDTIPKMHRKSKLEADLKQLEKDIVLLERHPYIYVYDDNELS